jgi:hypothetical protein
MPHYAVSFYKPPQIEYMKVLLLALLSALFAITSSAQKITISGYIKDEASGEAMQTVKK